MSVNLGRSVDSVRARHLLFVSQQVKGGHVLRMLLHPNQELEPPAELVRFTSGIDQIVRDASSIHPGPALPSRDTLAIRSIALLSPAGEPVG